MDTSPTLPPAEQKELPTITPADCSEVRAEAIQEAFLATGALLLRGWPLADVEQFRELVGTVSGGAPFFDYAGGASPRTAIGEGSGVYTSTEYPPHVGLSLHNELSYADLYPSQLYFFCLVAPSDGGETTFGDSRRILQRIDPEVAAEFRAKGIRYIRNLSPDAGSGYSWQDAFETGDRAVAEARCTALGAEYEWEDGFLRMWQVRPATAFHPRTGEEVWFNQADGFHPNALDRETYAALLAYAGSEARFRLNVSFGDCSPIDAAALAHVRAAITEETRLHRWRQGDVLVLDNLLSAHGRRPFTGPRKIALAMI